MSTWTNRLLALILLSLPCGAAAQTLKIAPPEGYCVDPEPSGAMMVMGRCADSRAVPAVLTVMAGQAGSAAALADRDAVARWLTTEAGRAALSRRGRARDVTVVEMRSRGDALLIHLRDPAAMGDAWRIMVPLAGRMVTLTVSATRPVTAAQMLEVADRFLLSMRRANRS